MGCILLKRRRCAQRVGKKSTPSVEAAVPAAIVSSSRAAKSFQKSLLLSSAREKNQLSQ
jgi:hypothetical protein